MYKSAVIQVSCNGYMYRLADIYDFVTHIAANEYKPVKF